MDWYSHGTEVDIRAPTQRSLCFFLWFMYCKTLKEELVLCSGICSWGFGHNEIRVGSASPAPLGSVLYKELNSGTSPRSFSKAEEMCPPKIPKLRIWDWDFWEWPRKFKSRV